jgi:predicted enzyme related to lactoylglutathione lyase
MCIIRRLVSEKKSRFIKARVYTNDLLLSKCITPGFAMPRVLGLGGLFFKSADPAATQEWYARVLGVPMEKWGAFFKPADAAAHPGAGTVFSPFAADTKYFAPSDKEFMFNLIVDDLDGILARCAEHGVVSLCGIVNEVNGRFAHVMDPDGRKVELWEPKPVDC